jgi:guanine deaminase
MNKFMEMAIEEAKKGVDKGDGGPFGSVVVKEGQVIARGHNHVVSNNDPTCHGEIDAIRKACLALNTFDLSGCEIYTTGEPCPMCACAIMWSNIGKVYYGCTIEDNAAIGFRDEKFASFFHMDKRPSFYEETDRMECLELFAYYKSIKDKIAY